LSSQSAGDRCFPSDCMNGACLLHSQEFPCNLPIASQWRETHFGTWNFVELGVAGEIRRSGADMLYTYTHRAVRVLAIVFSALLLARDFEETSNFKGNWWGHYQTKLRQGIAQQITMIPYSKEQLISCQSRIRG